MREGENMKIYVASSWRNETQPDVVEMLLLEGHEVYDFKNPKEGDKGFHWSEIDPDWESWNGDKYRDALSHPLAEEGFKSDYAAMEWADACVLVLPCGRSAHIEAGYFNGKGKKLIILLFDYELIPELMYKMADHVCVNMREVVAAITDVPVPERPVDARIYTSGWIWLNMGKDLPDGHYWYDGERFHEV